MLSRRQLASLNGVAAIRRYHARTGFTYAGAKIWTADELAQLALYPDYLALERALPGRTRGAIAGKIFKMGLARKRRVWDPHQEGILPRRYPTSEPVRLIAADVGKTNEQVWEKAKRKRLRRPRRRPCLIGVHIIDQIRQRAFDMNINLRELEEMGSKKGAFGRRSTIYWPAVARVLPQLAGRIALKW
jgi:hypothetical protein